MTAKRTDTGFTQEEKAAMRERARELRAKKRAAADDPEGDLLAKIDEMPEPDRAIAHRIHALVKAHAPSLAPRTWYGMPAYSKDGDVLIFFRNRDKFKERYSTIGFNDVAQLDDGRMWPTQYALTELTAADEAKIVALLKRAIG